VSAVANSSPLIVFAKLNCFDLLRALYPQVYISEEVHSEVVISGAGLAGASEVAKAEWIEVKRLKYHGELLALQEKYALGIGELSTILLARQIHADAVLLDDYNARKLAKAEGLQVQGSVGLLESLHLRGHLADLRATFRELLTHAYVDQRLLDHRLRAWGSYLCRAGGAGFRVEFSAGPRFQF